MAVGLNVTVLGCSGSFPGPGQACSGYLIQGGGVNVWLDAGSGTMANLQRHIGLDEVDAVVLSHEHPDHWHDIEGFAVATAYFLERKGVRVYAPTTFKRLTYHVHAPALLWTSVSEGDAVDIGDLRLTFSRTDHGPETLAVRIDGEGRALGYSADTGPKWSLASLGPGLHTVLCEASLLESQLGSPRGVRHLSGRQAGEMARDAGVGRLVLTHFGPGNDRDVTRTEAEAAFGAPVVLATENGAFEV
ncbi:MAG TPA: MBL fold metallo-hydrolase [Acidimicrobiales bacterium]|nr:MBL fold metallo-hydrolase [Acidimicrobiales bacterium]